MTQREQRLAAFLIVLIIVVGGSGLYYVFIHRPFDEMNNLLRRAQNDIDKKSDNLKTESARQKEILTENPKLKTWKKISLPAPPSRVKLEIKQHNDHLQVDYERYLSDMLADSRLNTSDVSVTSKGFDDKSGPKLSGRKRLYSNLTFNIQGKGELGNIVAFLEKLYNTPLLHHVRNLTLTKPQTRSRNDNRSALDFLITVEAIQVTGATKREELMPEDDSDVPWVLADLERDYGALLDKNMFEGYKREVQPREREPDRPREPTEVVLGAVKLCHIEHTGERWEARFFDQGKAEPEKMISPGSILSEFEIKDSYDNVVVKGEVVHITTTQRIFLKVDDEYYKMDLGQFMSDALITPLSVFKETRRYIYYHGEEGYVKLSVGRRNKPAEVLRAVPFALGPAALVEDSDTYVPPPPPPMDPEGE